MKHKVAFSSLALLSAGLALSQLACNSPSPRTEGSPPPPVAVQVVRVEPAPFEDFYESAGTVRAQERAVIASKVTGTILQVSVRPGDRVRAGQPLLQIES